MLLPVTIGYPGALQLVNAFCMSGFVDESEILSGLNEPGSPVTVTVPVTVWPTSNGPVGLYENSICGAGFTFMIAEEESAVTAALSVTCNSKEY